MSAADLLRARAGHFALSEWDYTRLHDIDDIRPRTVRPYDRAHRRLGRAAVELIRRPARWERELTGATGLWTAIRLRARAAVAESRRHKSRPDGVLDGGAVITYWEETGEYLQMVQPSVGLLLADFLAAEPDHPHARAIAAEIDRIESRFAARVRAGEVDGRARAAQGDD